MKMNTLLGFVFVLALLVILSTTPASANFCPDIDNIILTDPITPYVTGDVHTTVDFGFYQDNAAGSDSNCYLQLWNVSTGQSYPASANVQQIAYNTPTNFTLANPPASSPLEGVYYWNVFCADNSTGTCTNTTYAPNRTITFDRTGPVVTTTDPANIVFEDATRIFNFTSNDDYASGTYDCEIYIDGVLAGSDTVTDGVFAEVNGTALTEGVKSWYASCTDSYGNVGNSSAIDYIYDTTSMTINLSLAPANGATESSNKTVFFNITPVDEYSATGINCTLYVNNTESSSAIVANATTANLSHTFTADGSYDWNVTCTDPYGNSESSATRTLIADIGPDAPTVWNAPTVLNTLWSNFVGFVNKFANITISAQNQGNGSVYTNSTLTIGYPLETNYLGTALISQVFNATNTTFNTNDTTFALSGNLTASNFIAFANHNRDDYLYYDIVSVNTFPSYATIVVSPPFEDAVIVGESFTVYDRLYPTGWFNTSVDLFEGLNSVSLVGEHDSIAGDDTTVLVFVDAQGPTIEHNLSVVAQQNETFAINLTDNYNLSLTGLVVNVTNGVSDWSFVTDVSSYNVTAWNTITPNLSCSSTSTTVASCSWIGNLTDGVYNISIYASDYLGTVSTVNITNFVIKSTVEVVPIIWHVDGPTTLNAQFNVSWNFSLDPFLDYYEIAVGTLPGYSDVVDWTWVNASVNNTLIVNDSIQYGQIYYVSIRPIDLAGLIGDSTSTQLIYTQDGTVPLTHTVAIDTQVGGWITSATSLDLEWNFTDNETGIALYEYAVGTTNYSVFSGWDDTVSTQQTTNTSGELLTNLTLTEGESYYLSARAKNTYPFSAMWSGWTSSSPATVDSIAPTGTSISYSSGSYTVPSVTISYATGSDSGSGMFSAVLRYRRATLSNGVCEAYASWQTANASIVLSAGGTTYDYTDLASGYCYQFGTLVSDIAGNQVFTAGPATSNVSLDTTAPSAVTIDNTPGIISSLNLSFSWSVSNENESTLSHYMCGLGTTSGNTEVTGWTNCGDSPAITLANLSLVDGTIYYFSVRPYNSYGLAGPVSTSYGMLYFDVTLPQALTVTQVGADTTSPWVDLVDTNNWSVVELTGEGSLNCVWSVYDIPYTDPSASYATACTEPSLGVYNCNITNLVEGTTDISVACKDASNNAQTAAQNVDLSFTKELSAPSISFITPDVSGKVYSPTTLEVVTNITDVSSYVATYTVSIVATNQVLTSGSLINDSVTLNLSTYSGENKITITAVDAYSHSASAETTFYVTNGEPQHVVVNNQTATSIATPLVLSENMTLITTFYFVNETNISLQNASGIIGAYTATSAQANISDTLEVNMSLDQADFADGTYTFVVQASGAVNTTPIASNYTVIFDTTIPYIDTTAVETAPNSSVNESLSSVSVYVVADDTSALDTIRLNYTIANNSYSSVAVNTTPRAWRPNESRYVVDIPGYQLIANETINYSWTVTDAAGNSNYTTPRIVPIVNQLVDITPANLTAGLAGTPYYQTINFTDDDSSQTNFTCTISPAQATLSIAHAPGTQTCLLSWTTPVTGNHNFTVNVTDNSLFNTVLDTMQENYTVEIVNNSNYTVTLNTDVFDFTALVTAATNYTEDEHSLSQGATLFSVPYATNYTLTLSRPEFSVVAYGAPTINATLFFRKNQTTILYAADDLGVDDQYLPLRSYAVNLSFDSGNATSYVVSFDYTAFGYDDTTSQDLRIFKYAYDEATETILYTDSDSVGLLTTVRDTTANTISATVYNFSAFVLAEKVPTCFDTILNQGEEGVDCGGPCSASCPSSSGGSGSSGGSSSGFSGSISVSATTCDDGIKNQNEIEIDCGGVCGACAEPVVTIPTPTCDDGIKNQDETAIDCGGLTCQTCAPVFSCSDTIQNQGEEGVDCGGPCAACQEPDSVDTGLRQEPQLQAPQKTSLFNSPYLYGLFGFILIGAIIVVIIEAPRRTPGPAKEILAAEQLPEHDNLVHIVQKIHQQELEGKDDVVIKIALEHQGFDASIVDRALMALEQKERLNSLVNYFETYSLEGYSLDEMLNWLASQGIDEDVLSVAVGLYKKHESY